MKKKLLSVVMIACSLGFLHAQPVSDFESGFSGSKGVNGQPDYQPGSAEFEIVDNPSKAGINTSDKVGRFTRKVNGNWWAYAWFEFAPIEITASRTAPKYLHIKVYKPLVSTVCAQLKDKHDEPTANSGEIINKKQTKENEWQDLVFKITTSGVYSYLEFKPDFENYEVPSRLTSDIQIYFDDVVINDDPTGVGEEPEPVIVFEGNLPENFEGANTLLDTRFYGENYGTFGNNESEPQYLSTVENPYVDQVNVSAHCAKFIRRVTGEWWAGVWMQPKEPVVVDVTRNYFHVFVYKPMESAVTLKLEGAVSTGDIQAINSGDRTDEWVDYVFEFGADKYGSYDKINFMPDFVPDLAPTDRFIKDQMIYFDDMVINGDPTPRVSNVSGLSATMVKPMNWLDGNNQFHLGKAGSQIVKVYTVDGRLSASYVTSDAVVDFSGLQRGFYIVKTDDNGESQITKVKIK